MNLYKTCGFCPDCGSILPQLQMTGNINCYSCKKEFDVELYGDMKTAYSINCNTYDKSKDSMKNESNEDEVEGPVVNRVCPQCACTQMSYATLQLRSADEGQTVFYTCVKCKFKETENS